MPLTMAKPGESRYIKSINGRDEVRQRLSELGFSIGSQVTVINELSGNLILRVRESRVALSKGMASRIIV